MHESKDRQTTLSRLKQAYDGTDMPAEVERRVYQKVFARRNPQKGALIWRLSWSTVAVIFVVLALFWGYLLNRYILTETDGSQPAVYRAKVAQLNGRVNVDSLRGGSAPAGLEMPLPGLSTVHTSSASSAGLEIGPHRAVLSADTVFELDNLKIGHLRFLLERGKVEMTVAPLGKDESLVIVSDDLRVEVVGTIFSVERRGVCHSVAVTKGRVKATFRNRVHFLGAFESREFCPESDRTRDVKPERTPVRGRANKEDLSLRRPVLPSVNRRAELALGKPSQEHKSNGRAYREPDRLTPTPHSMGETTEKSSGAPRPNETVLSTEQHSSERKEAYNGVPAATDTPPTDEEIRPADEIQPADEVFAEDTHQITGEEQLYRSALSDLVDGQRRPALKRFLLYLERYPAGLFHEDALFNAVRLFYKLDKMEEVIRYGGQFVERYPRSGLRSTEVRILYAQGVVAEKQNPEMALRALRPVINRINSISLALQEQAIYLYFHATFKTGNKGVAIQWAEHYLKRFPRGRYVEEAKKIIQ